MSKYSKVILGLVIGVILIGAIVPFGAQFLLPFFNTGAFIQGAEVWNQYVSIVLGVVATILSVVSLKMCFSSEESSKKSEKRTELIWQKVEDKLEILSQKQDYIYHTVSQNHSNTQTKVVDGIDADWEKAQKNSKTNMIISEEV